MTGFEPETSNSEATALPTEPQPLPIKRLALETLKPVLCFLALPLYHFIGHFVNKVSFTHCLCTRQHITI